MWFLHEKPAITNCPCVGAPRPLLLQGLTGPSLELYLRPFLRIHRYEAKPAKVKGSWGEVQGKPGANSQSLLPVESLLNTSCDMCEKFSVAADRDAVSKILLGTDRTSNLCLPRTKFQTPGGKHKSGCSHQYFRHSQALFSCWEWWEFSRNPSFQMPVNNQPY